LKGRWRNSLKMFIENLSRSDHFEDVGVDWRMIVKDLKEE
jgi:hypothetical protein